MDDCWWRYGATSVWWLSDHHPATVWFLLPPTGHGLSPCRSQTGRPFPIGHSSASRHHPLVHGGQQVACPCLAWRHDGEMNSCWRLTPPRQQWQKQPWKIFSRCSRFHQRYFWVDLILLASVGSQGFSSNFWQSHISIIRQPIWCQIGVYEYDIKEKRLELLKK